MNPRLAAALVAAFFVLPLAPARGQPAEAIPTVVLVDESLTDLYYLAPSLDVHYVGVSDLPPVNYAAVGIIPGALGAAIGTALVNAEARKAAQRQANVAVAPLMEPLGRTGLQGPLRQAFAAALPAHGMDQKALLFTGGAKLDRKHFTRIPAAKQAGRFVLVGYGDMARDALMMPVAMHDSLRQLRLALDVEVREGSASRNRRVLKRDVVYYSQPLAVPEGAKPLDLLAADDHAQLRREIAEAVATTLAMVHQPREFPDLEKDAEVGVVTELGLTEFEGVLLEQAQGRALIWTRGGSYVSIPTGQVVTGEALVAARETETTRRNPPKADDAEVEVEADLAADPQVVPDAAPAEAAATEATGADPAPGA